MAALVDVGADLREAAFGESFSEFFEVGEDGGLGTSRGRSVLMRDEIDIGFAAFGEGDGLACASDSLGDF